MVHKEDILFLIPARGGSKGLPGKNIKVLNGLPLICYAIKEAQKLTSNKNICVSTDDKEIKETVEDFGLKVPFIRPEYLATDTASSYDVIIHALEYYKNIGKEFKVLVLLQPTSPFRKAKHIKDAISIFYKEIDMVVSVKETRSNPYYVLFEENENGFLEKSKKGNFTRRQEIPLVYEFNGAIYVINVKSIYKSKIGDFTRIVKYLMDEKSSVDIDSEMDWKIAELIIKEEIQNEHS